MVGESHGERNVIKMTGLSAWESLLSRETAQEEEEK